MATVAHAFSPKEFEVWVKAESTAGTSVLATSGMYQLDVDSVSMPSLNVNQVLDVRSGSGRTLKRADFFQDNTLKVIELSISGTMHNDTGHNLLMYNITNCTSGDPTIASGFTPSSQLYGSSVANATSAMTVVIKPSDHTNQTSLEMPGMVVTNFALSADAGEEGGRYKFSATLQSGFVADLDESSALAGGTAYANTTTKSLTTGSGFKVFNVDTIMQSFTLTIDNPAVFTGVTSNGFESVSRGAETSVTVDTQVKYDGNTKGFINYLNVQDTTVLNSQISAGNLFLITNNNAFGVNIQNGIVTNVAYSEGDIMMLDCSLKAVDDGSDALVVIDVTS